jgi:hypothetical protein
VPGKQRNRPCGNYQNHFSGFANRELTHHANRA